MGRHEARLVSRPCGLTGDEQQTLMTLWSIGRSLPSHASGLYRLSPVP
jgi:hypothetical protein